MTDVLIAGNASNDRTRALARGANDTELFVLAQRAVHRRVSRTPTLLSPRDPMLAP